MSGGAWVAQLAQALPLPIPLLSHIWESHYTSPDVANSNYSAIILVLLLPSNYNKSKTHVSPYSLIFSPTGEPTLLFPGKPHYVQNKSLHIPRVWGIINIHYRPNLGWIIDSLPFQANIAQVWELSDTLLQVHSFATCETESSPVICES